MSVFTRFLHGLEETPDPSETLSERLPAIAAVLKRLRVCRVRVRYDDRYDLRSVEAPMWLTALGSVFEPGVPATVRFELQVFFTELLEMRHPGWANAEGARGEFVWTVETDELIHTHQLRYTDYKTTTAKGL
jgi:hypothetical protein